MRDQVVESREWTTIGMLKICGLCFLALSAIFLPFPEIDLWAAELFYNGNNDFWLRKTLFNAWLNAYIRPAVGVIAVVGLLLYLLLRLTATAARAKRLARYGFLLVSIALASGLVVHAVLKDNWGRARPKHVVEFDGEKIFTPPLLPADQCHRNCSFVSGDASLGYVFIALALYAQRRRKFWISVTVGAGLSLGLMRMMNGSHFLSDILFAGVFTCGTVLLLYRWFVEEYWAADSAPLRRVLAPVGKAITALAVTLSTPGMRDGFGRAKIRVKRLVERFV